jgi:hypothetical protein
MPIVFMRAASSEHCDEVMSGSAGTSWYAMPVEAHVRKGFYDTLDIDLTHP